MLRADRGEVDAMKAIVQDGYGSADALQLREIERPVVTEGRVLVRVRAASVNALDWHSVHGGRVIRLIGALLRQKATPIRGVDVAGIVEEIGPNVTRLRPGDEVFGLARGTFAEYALGRETGLVPKPVQLSFTQAGAMGVAAVTALEALRDRGQLKPGQHVLIHGAGGGVGTFAVQIARALGAHVTAVTGTRNLDVIRPLGPDVLIDYTQEDFTRRPQRYDVIVDIAATRSLADLKRVLTPNGMLVITGAPKTGMVRLLARVIGGLVQSRFDRRLVSFVARAQYEDLVFLKELVEAGKLCPVIDREYALSDAAEAVRYVGTGQARAKVVITM